MRAGEVLIQGEVRGKRPRGRPNTSYSGNIAKCCMVEVRKNSRGIALDEENNWCQALHGRLIVIPDGTTKEGTYWVNLSIELDNGGAL